MSATTSDQTDDDLPPLSEVLTAVILAGPVLMMRAWVITLLWGWYAVPAFGVQPLRAIYVYGLILLVMYITPTRPHRNTKKIYVLACGAVGPALVTLAFGWLGTWFI